MSLETLRMSLNIQNLCWWVLNTNGEEYEALGRVHNDGDNTHLRDVLLAGNKGDTIMAKACKFCVRLNSFVCNDYYCDNCNMCASTSKEDKEGN